MNIGTLTDEELAEAVSIKASIILHRKLKTPALNPEIKYNVKQVVVTLAKIYSEVFNSRPEFNIAIVMMALSFLDAHKETVNKTRTPKVICPIKIDEIIYL